MMELEVLTENIGSILHSQVETSCFVDGLQIGCGNLVVTSSEITWANGSGRGFKINYHWITVHAISKDLNSFPHPCIYMMTENVSCSYRKQGKSEDDVNGEDGNADHSPEEEENIIEIRFVPSDADSLTTIYQAINQGSHLNPAEESGVSDDGDDEFEPDFEEGQGDYAGGDVEHESEEQDYSGGDQGQFDNADEAMEH